MTVSFPSLARGIPDVEFGPAAPAAEVADHLAGLALPAAHLGALSSANGVSVYGGYFRLFGVGPRAAIDLVRWNAPGLWKFAWPPGPDRFVCFGETAWGDQYAYARSDLARGEPSPPVYFLDALAMAPEVIARDFESFLDFELLRNARRPYDDVLVQVRARLGDLGPGEHIAHAPSTLLSEAEEPGAVVKLDAVAAMIAGGDLFRQLHSAPAHSAVESLEPYTDARGRPRLRVVWA